ncbi:MAG: double-strand break repair helicase AddA [Methyloceanibacter sp.]|uniref:double-strand break repair helicase AddA n=1 Tax=Methyloceanibacter sp. TaxID=1965321 RepID=UPI003EE0005E
MSGAPELLHEADANQARASDPGASAWVSANAGTGKTAVLVKRVLRLLLAGSRPESILCLTYTKTAAAEMQNRLLKELAGWATMTDEDLRKALSKLMEAPPENEDLRAARRLFACALEARGGLKIHTIHGFCERLLQRFPLEAMVTPHFTVLDEQSAVLHKRDAFDAVVTRAADAPDSALGLALAKIIGLTSEDYFRQVVNVVLLKRAELTRMMALHDSLEDWAAAEAEALKQFLGVADTEEDAIVAAQAAALSDDQIDAAIAALSAYGGSAKTDKDLEASLTSARRSKREGRTAALRSVFLTQKGEPRASVYTKGFGNDAPGIAAILDEAKVAFAGLQMNLAHLRVAEASGAVIALADAIQAEYERRKRDEAALDYDDLIVKAQMLLSRSGAAAWVLYKIDGGVDHILVDEAQDTNPDQWSIIEALAEEFFAGRGASDRLRTLFAVGDEKQSIYSFQGANPARFGAVGSKFRKRARDAQTEWYEVPLNVSFRSTVPVLDAVDHVFAQSTAAQGLTFVENAIIKHHAFRQGDAGLVELWEVETTEKPEPAPPFEPWNEDVTGASAIDALCKRIAKLIKGWLDSNEPLASQGRPIQAGDILILVRRRDPFTAPMIRALKHAKVPVAGADRMRLMDQLAVKDLVALADVLLMPEDDLALAVVLKSPLFDLDDEALFDLAYERGRASLWSVLKDKAREDARFEEAAARIADWLGQADTLPPYEFFAGLLGAEGQKMRKRMLTRLGPEAAEAIDEFLDTALAFDRDATPSLQGFVHDLRNGVIDIKRDMDQDRDEVRIMTVHGAKGLQAPIVILPDTCANPRGQGPRVFEAARPGYPPDAACHLLWPPKGHSNVPGLLPAKSAADQADSEEYHRLLYVAMTRARDRLYVCGWQGVRQREGNCWYDLIEQGLRPHLTQTAGEDGPVRRMLSEQQKPVEAAKTEKVSPAVPPLPDWALKPAPYERVRTRLAPSRLALNAKGGGAFGAEQAPLGPKALAEDLRFARGRLVHALLQHLPEVASEDRERAARTFVAMRGGGLPEALREEIVAESLAIVRDETFAPLFRPGSLAEVPVVARIGEGESSFDLEGQIDRLAILDEGLLILDYKTNRPPPSTEADVARAYINQLAAYRLALLRMFPQKSVRAALLWTDGPRLMEISSTLLDTAERDMLSRLAALTP